MDDPNAEVNVNNDENVAELENELQTLYLNCLESHKTAVQIKSAAKPFLQTPSTMPGSNGKITLLKFVVLPVVMILLGGLLSNQSCNQFMKHSFRRTIIHICSNVSEVTVLLDTSEEDIANHFSEMMVTDFLYDIEYVTCLSGSSLTVGLAGRIDL
ncbi:hypothetical protein MAR_024937 [Mya arenaria]|uniref:Uncharacterized protein n=1 Tax=Mya arenaria TaxID=6604 RepID=A0ABY7DV93_MYAAR|nr:hypothetical protein MAR_024937 [Mya arenaria]